MLQWEVYSGLIFHLQMPAWKVYSFLLQGRNVWTFHAVNKFAGHLHKGGYIESEWDNPQRCEMGQGELVLKIYLLCASDPDAKQLLARGLFTP